MNQFIDLAMRTLMAQEPSQTMRVMQRVLEYNGGIHDAFMGSQYKNEIKGLTFDWRDEDECHFTIRTEMIDGEPWFNGSDVCKALGYTNSRKALTDHVVDDDDVTKRYIRSGGQMRSMTYINESGLYSLILSSKLPSAKKFKRWVTKEVIPSIRKTGRYGAAIDELPSYLKRLRMNYDSVPHTHFSILTAINDIYMDFEKAGYVIQDYSPSGEAITPDISVGRLFAKHLKEINHPMLKQCRKYLHHYPDGRSCTAALYPNELYSEFKRFLHEDWMKNHAYRYFSKRDTKALDYLPKLLKAI